MTLVEVLVSSVIASIVLLASSQACFQVYQVVTQQNNLSVLQSESMQAFRMMGEAIWYAQAKIGSNKLSSTSFLTVMAKDSAAPSNKKAGELQARKGAASVNSSDTFYTYDAQHKKGDHSYKAFFVQQQGHYAARDGVLYIQTQNGKGHLQNDALIAHVQSMQIQVGVIQHQSVLWLEPYQINESKKRFPQWKDVRALKIQLSLQKGKTQLALERIFALRH